MQERAGDRQHRDDWCPAEIAESIIQSRQSSRGAHRLPQDTIFSVFHFPERRSYGIRE